jgi:ribosomal protein L18E
VSVKAHLFSKSALDKIQKAGGAVETIAAPERQAAEEK